MFRGGLANVRLTASQRRARFGVLSVFAVFRSRARLWLAVKRGDDFVPILDLPGTPEEPFDFGGVAGHRRRHRDSSA